MHRFDSRAKRWLASGSRSAYRRAMPALKVFRTPIGFHDAYVAAPSRKAALAAWGAEADLFARGMAEQVTDPALTAEPLAKPGVVVKRLRGTAAEQFAALPPDKPAAAKPKRASKPPPSRAALDAAEAALAEAEMRRAAEDAAIREREAALARERAAMEKRHAAEAARLEGARDDAKAAYELALRAWTG